MAERSDWRMPLVPGRPNVGAEVIHAIRDEMACTLADIVIRRSELGAAGHPGADMVTAIARDRGAKSSGGMPTPPRIRVEVLSRQVDRVSTSVLPTLPIGVYSIGGTFPAIALLNAGMSVACSFSKPAFADASSFSITSSTCICVSVGL